MLVHKGNTVIKQSACTLENMLLTCLLFALFCLVYIPNEVNGLRTSKVKIG